MSSDINRAKIAAALAISASKRFRLDAAIDAIPVAPVAESIAAMLAESPDLVERPLLEGIADLNQGRLEDLESPEFRSYLIRKLGVEEFRLNACIRALLTYVRVARAQSAGSDELLAAARSEDGTSSRHASASDILRELRRRK